MAKLPGCGGDDIIGTFDFRKPDFAASCFYSCTARVKEVCVSALVSKSVRIRSPDSESAACASRVEKPNPTGDDHKRRQQNNRGIPKEDGRM